jgi:hypothetical protein
MKKLFLAAVAVLAFGSFSYSAVHFQPANFEMKNDQYLLFIDCFQHSIDFLEDLESTLGYRLSWSHQTLILNDVYASCECVGNGNCHIK